MQKTPEQKDQVLMFLAPMKLFEKLTLGWGRDFSPGSDTGKVAQIIKGKTIHICLFYFPRHKRMMEFCESARQYLERRSKKNLAKTPKKNQRPKLGRI